MYPLHDARLQADRSAPASRHLPDARSATNISRTPAGPLSAPRRRCRGPRRNSPNSSSSRRTTVMTKADRSAEDPARRIPGVTRVGTRLPTLDAQPPERRRLQRPGRRIRDGARRHGGRSTEVRMDKRSGTTPTIMLGAAGGAAMNPRPALPATGAAAPDRPRGGGSGRRPRRTARGRCALATTRPRAGRRRPRRRRGDARRAGQSTAATSCPSTTTGTADDVPNDLDVSPTRYVDHHHGSRFHHHDHLGDEHLDDHIDDDHIDDELHDVDLDDDNDDDNDRGAGALPCRRRLQPLR